MAVIGVMEEWEADIQVSQTKKKTRKSKEIQLEDHSLMISLHHILSDSVVVAVMVI